MSWPLAYNGSIEVVGIVDPLTPISSVTCKPPRASSLATLLQNVIKVMPFGIVCGKFKSISSPNVCTPVVSFKRLSMFGHKSLSALQADFAIKI